VLVLIARLERRLGLCQGAQRQTPQRAPDQPRQTETAEQHRQAGQELAGHRPLDGEAAHRLTGGVQCAIAGQRWSVATLWGGKQDLVGLVYDRDSGVR